MDIRIKALLAAFPFIIAAYVGFSMLQPAMDDANAKESQVSEKQSENEKLQTQLQGSKTVNQRLTQLTQEIEGLRQSVPKTPDTDLLAIDLEKMCRDAGMNMVAFLPDKDREDSSAKAAAADNSANDNVKKKQDRLKNMLKGGGAGDSGSSGVAIKAPTELSSSYRKFIVTGDYAGLQKLIHEIETYQRVLKIDLVP